MPEPAPVTPATVIKIATEFLGVTLTSGDTGAVAGLLNGLAADMQAFRKMSVVNDEPTTVYAAVEGQP